MIIGTVTVTRPMVHATAALVAAMVSFCADEGRLGPPAIAKYSYARDGDRGLGCPEFICFSRRSPIYADRRRFRVLVYLDVWDLSRDRKGSYGQSAE